MARGDKTKVCAAIACNSFVPAFVDPTGVSILVFLGSGSAATVGCLYHGARKTVEGIQELVEDNRIRKSQNNPLGMSPSQHCQFQFEVELAFRRLVAAVGGVTVNGALLVNLPIFGIAFSLNVKNVIKEAGRLHSLARSAGGYRHLVKNVSLQNITLQGAAGVAIKTITTFIFIGDEIHDFMDSINNMAGFFSSHPIHANHIMGAYDHLISHRPLEVTTQAASAPIDAIKDHFGYRGGWEWEDHNPLHEVLEVGAVIAAVDKGVDVVAEGPMHASVNKITAGRKRRC